MAPRRTATRSSIGRTRSDDHASVHGAPSGAAAVPRFSIGYLDRSISPAENFYQFADGAWVAQNPVPSDKARWSAFNELSDRNFALLREILEELSHPSTRPKDRVGRQVGDFYVAATDRARRDRLKFAPIAKDLARIRSLRTPRQLLDRLIAFHNEGISPLFATYAAPDKRESSVYVLYLVQSGLSLPDREYYLREQFAKIRSAYRSHLRRSWKLLGESAPRAAADATTVLRIETELARASKSRTDLRDPEKNYHRFTAKELALRYPRVDWTAYFSGRGIRRPPFVVVGQPEFFDALHRLLERTSIDDWKVYLRWHLVRRVAPHLHTPMERESFGFYHRTLLGQEKPEPDWKRAALFTDDALGEALGRLYVARHFPPEAGARMRELVLDLQAVFRSRLAQLPWMTEDTRRQALEKFDLFTTKIGHPTRFRDYSKVRVSRGDHLGNLRRADSFEVRRTTSRVGKKVDRTEWMMTPPTVNAYFEPSLNEIVFPAGILQPPFFDVTMDDAVNYGGIGVVIGHEITHGYDDEGRKYDGVGNLRDWWTPADAAQFTERAGKIIDQYSAFESLPGEHVNGELTAGENIADLGGVRIAYEALQRRLRDGRTPRDAIDGFTPEQRFFLSFAQIWRANIREAEARRLLTIDPHAPARFRVRGPLTNLPEFWEAFGVPPGSPMRASGDRQVEIW